MMSIMVGAVVVVIGMATLARLRLWYYERRLAQQVNAEMAIEARCHALRGQCSRIWWEGQW